LSAFELVFGLMSIITSLALTHAANIEEVFREAAARWTRHGARAAERWSREEARARRLISPDPRPN
jgi:hypothetical protein